MDMKLHFQVQSDSMAPDYAEGDFVVTTPEPVARPPTRAICAVELPSGVMMLRKVYDMGDTVHTEAINQDYEQNTLLHKEINLWPVRFYIRSVLSQTQLEVCGLEV